MTVTIPHSKVWTTNIFNANDGKRDLRCVTHFYLGPRHDATLVRQLLYDVALSSPSLNLDRPILINVAEEPWGTHYRIKACPVDARDQFQFISDLTIRGKSVLKEFNIQAALAFSALAMAAFRQDREEDAS